MDRYKVSGADLREFYSAETRLSQVFGDIEHDLQAQNRVVCQFIVNGMKLSETDEGRFAEIELREVETLEYLAENKNKLVGQVLTAWQQAIPELMLASEKLCQRMRFQGPKGIFKDIHDLVENVEHLITSLVSLRTMVSAEMHGRIKGWSAAELNSKKTIVEALTAVEKKDFVLLADILEYDLNTVLQQWADCLSQLAVYVNGSEAEDARAKAEQQIRSDSAVRGRIAH